MTRPRSPRDRGGFALALVVLMLFAIGVAATAAYEVVSSEFTLATSNRESALALSVARAGLQRFIGEQIGVVGDSVSYAIGAGVATVTTRRLLEEDSLTYLYIIESEGTVTDVRTPDSPARRTVATYARLHMSPVKHKAAMLLAASTVYLIYGSTYVNGYDGASFYDCSGGGTSGVAGVAAANYAYTYYGAYLYGNPTRRAYGSTSAVIDSAGIRWDILSDPNFPVEFDGAPPDWSKIPSDSFPVVRKVGNLYQPDSATWSGQGVLIVTGTLTMGYHFAWKGIILAGTLADVSSSPVIEGTIIANLNDTDPTVYITSGTFRYNSCYVYQADASLSYLEVVDKTIFEINN